MRVIGRHWTSYGIKHRILSGGVRNTPSSFFVKAAAAVGIAKNNQNSAGITYCYRHMSKLGRGSGLMIDIPVLKYVFIPPTRALAHHWMRYSLAASKREGPPSRPLRRSCRQPHCDGKLPPPVVRIVSVCNQPKANKRHIKRPEKTTSPHERKTQKKCETTPFCCGCCE